MGSSRLISRRRQDLGSKWARISIAFLSTLGLIDTGSITISSWGWMGPLTCPGGKDACDMVLKSPWGMIFERNGLSIPLSFLGVISYLLILTMSILPLLPVLSENKVDMYHRTWWGIFLTSCGMTIFSLILIGLMYLKIPTYYGLEKGSLTCVFCIVSACLSLCIFMLSIIGGVWDNGGQLIFRGILVSLAFLLGGLIWASSVNPSMINNEMAANIAPPVQSKSSLAKIELAKHLTRENAVIYTAYWCSHCRDQKEMFGKEAVKRLQVIECAVDGVNNQNTLCKIKGIQGYPSWEINGQIDSGVRTLNELANLSGYKGSRRF